MMLGKVFAIREYIQQHPVINTHCHQNLAFGKAPFSLAVLFRNSYVNWSGALPDENRADRSALLNTVRHRSYFVWLEKAIRQLYGLKSILTIENWEDTSEAIRAAHARDGYWLDVLKTQCRYQKMIEDAYWDPGDDQGCPSLFAPAFRINSLFYGYHREAKDHNGTNALQLYNDGVLPDTLEEYLYFVKNTIEQKIQEGTAALKLAIAYDRGLDFQEATKNSAQTAYASLGASPSDEDRRVFQNYLLSEICQLAAERNIPIQIHTGMGKLERSNALWLQGTIQRHPGTRFVLLHCSLPWTDDILALVHFHQNVFPDLSWLPLFSPTRARQVLHELIEVGAADKICWGCDTWTPEESCGALLALQTVLETVLAEKMDSGYLSHEAALDITSKILFKNSTNIYPLQGLPIL